MPTTDPTGAVDAPRIRRHPATYHRPLRRGSHEGDDRRPEPVDERGQATVLVAIVVVLAVLATLAVGRLGSAAVERARARTAADAAALAAVVDEASGGGAGRRRADSVAAANGATVVSYRVDGTEVEVEVRWGSAHATSRADRAAARPAPR